MTNAPPGYQPVAGARRNDVGGKPGPVSHALVAELVTVARREMAVLDLQLSANKLSRIVRAYLATDQERDLVSWVIAYADPTGETAVRNVMRELSRSS
jgi:hypothetical protein